MLSMVGALILAIPTCIQRYLTEIFFFFCRLYSVLLASRPLFRSVPQAKQSDQMALLENFRVGRKKFSFHFKKKKTFCFLTEVKENDCNLNMKELFTIKSTILHIYLHHVSVKNHQLLQNTKNYMTEETKNLIKNISRYEKYCCLGVFTSSSSVYLYTTHCFLG